MYIKKTFANNIKVLLGILIGYTVIIFPLFLNIDLFYLKSANKLFFKLKLFFIPIIKGYIKRDNLKLKIKLNSKIIKISIKSLTKLKNNAKPLKDYHFIRVKSLIEVGDKDSSITPYMGVGLCNFICTYIEWFLNNKKPYLKFNYAFNVYEKEDVFNLYFNFTVVFNLLMILISIIKILVEKIANAIGKSKQQNQ